MSEVKIGMASLNPVSIDLQELQQFYRGEYVRA